MPVLYRFAVAWLVVVAVPAAAADKRDAPAPPPPGIFQAVLDCKALTEAAARLACFDRTVGAMAAASDQKELVVMDRAAVRETKRGLFGLNLPNLGILNSGADVDQITTTITSARMNPTGRYLLVLADGATWLQIENVGMSPPKPGDAITIRRAAMGSHLAKIKNGPAFRARRVVN